MKIVLQLLGLLACAALVFMGVFYLTFPSDTVAERIAWEAQERLDLAVAVEKPKPKGIGGVRFKSLQVGKLPKGDAKVRPFLSMGRTWVKAKPFAALRGRADARFDGVLYDGEAKGSVLYSEETIAADVTFEDLQVSSFPLQGETWFIEGGGSLDGEIDLTVNQEDITQSEGQISFDFDGLSFREGSQIYGMAFETVFSEAGGRITVENGNATVDKAKFKGDVLEGEVTGKISLKKDLMKSRMALKIKFKLLDETLESLLALKMGQNPSHRDDKGYYHYALSGPLDRPRPRDDRASARRANRTKGRTTEKDEDEGESENPKERSQRRAKRLDEMTDEERAEWEAERDERREALRKKRDERRKEMDGEREASGGREVHRRDEEFSEDLRVGGTVRHDEMAIEGPETDDPDDEFIEGEEEGGGDTDDEPGPGEVEGGGEGEEY